MKPAHVTAYIDKGYKGGTIDCACGWHKELGDGFNAYRIANCPQCTPELETRTQRKVVVGSPRNLTVTLGNHVYFVLDGEHGIHVQFSKQVSATYTGLSKRGADRL